LLVENGRRKALGGKRLPCRFFRQGQMLEYAANGVVYWPLEQIRAEFEKNCENAEERLVDKFERQQIEFT
jgi:hypothetical protein